MHEEHHAHLTHHGTAHAPHDKHAGHTPEMFRRRLVVSLLLTLPILYFSHELQQWLRFEAVRFPGSEWVTPVFAVALYVYGGWIFIEGAWRELRARAPGMMALVAMAITVAFVYSLAVTFGLRGNEAFLSSS